MALSIRRYLAGIIYSKKTVTVEFKYGRPSDASDSDFARPPDGKCLSYKRPSLAASHAAPLESLSARMSKSDLPLPARESKRPGPWVGPDLNGRLDSDYMVLGRGLEPLTPSMSRSYSNQLS